MKLKHFTIQGLHGQHESVVSINFNDDLTILTGDNGCGKTTILKIIWYLISPNVEQVFEEFEFDQITLTTTEYTLELKSGEHDKSASLTRRDNQSVEIALKMPETSDIKQNGKVITKELKSIVNIILDDLDSDPYTFKRRLGKINSYLSEPQFSSLFFPTFRRIEENIAKFEYGERRPNDIAHALSISSRKLSTNRHKYIAYVSTDDIKKLTMELASENSAKTRKEREELLQKITAVVNKSSANDTKIESKFLKIKKEIEKSDKRIKELNTRFEQIEQCIEEFITDKTIEISPFIQFGDSNKKTLRADDLSSGEKQILGFITYNGCYEDTPIIIDEPELSLGVDWQRKLLSALHNQAPSNQFIVATHSPLIYSRYPEKEVVLHG